MSIMKLNLVFTHPRKPPQTATKVIEKKTQQNTRITKQNNKHSKVKKKKNEINATNKEKNIKHIALDDKKDINCL